MTKKREIYRCPICGNIVEILHEAVFLLDKTTACGRVSAACDIKKVVARAYCNQHGLWKM